MWLIDTLLVELFCSFQLDSWRLIDVRYFWGVWIWMTRGISVDEDETGS
jgi:hypothetical protein